MATDTINPPPAPQRVFYSTGRMLGVADFQADQDYHRARLARALIQLYGTGTVSGLLVQTDGNPDPTQLEIQVTPGMAIDRIGRIIDVPRLVCIVANNWLNQYVQAWRAQQSGQVAIADPNSAIHDGSHLTVDVFATFVACTRGVTPCFAAEDDYDATDAFSANRYLDSFAMQLVLRTDPSPGLPVDPWKISGALPNGALSAITPANLTTLQNLLLSSSAGAAAPTAEYPPGFDTTSVFLARILIGATAGTSGNPPTWNLSNVTINNNARLFLYPAALMARFAGFASGSET